MVYLCTYCHYARSHPCWFPGYLLDPRREQERRGSVVGAFRGRDSVYKYDVYVGAQHVYF